MADQSEEPASAAWTSSGTTLRGVAGFAVAVGVLTFHLVSLRWLRAPGWKNKAEAREELRLLVKEHEGLQYVAWAERIGQAKRIEITSRAGIWYQARIEPVWDDKPGGAVRVLFSIDDGGVGAYHPLTDALLLDPPS
jgi:hypothetical protein